MAVSDYTRARKMAQKTYHQDISEGKYPYLKVLDELLPFADTVGENDLGLIEIPVERIVGTKTAGRTKAFSSSFMPLLSESSEFADKWSSLYRSHIDEGIREPVIACEFMNSYYIIEGNKRVSVLKYSGAITISGYVTRIIPAANDTKESRIYYEYMDFFRFTGINTIYFSKPGSFHELCSALSKTFGTPWSVEEKRLFSSCLLHFSKAYEEKGGAKIPITVGDAFLAYLNVYGYENMVDLPQETLKKQLAPLWEDLEALPCDKNVSVIMQPEEEPEKNILKLLKDPEKAIIQKFIAPSAPKLSVGFL